MNIPENQKKIVKSNMKIFLIKLVSISIAIVIVINLIFNLIFSERLEKIDKILSFNSSNERYEIKEKIRKELSDGLQKENMIAEEDKILLYKIFLKLKKEFENLDKSKI
tara:strand:+ start:14 stop:340 length:327 start_codon:yes stop_codon:yes gene_type:complete